MKSLLATIAIIFVAPSLFASANLRVTALATPDVVRAGLPFTIGFFVQNIGPDTAKNVVLTTTATAALRLGDMVAHTSSALPMSVTAPLTGGPFAVTATVSSDTEDADPSDNIAIRTVTVSTNPEIGRASCRERVCLVV